MNKWIAVVGFIGSAFLFAGTAGAQVVTSAPSKKIVASDEAGLDLTTNPVVRVQLLTPNKKKRLVMVTATVNTTSLATLTFNAKVNGVPLEPEQLQHKCAGACVFAATWWLDLDAAELANPGVFYNSLPLGVDLIAGANAASIGRISVTAQALKK